MGLTQKRCHHVPQQPEEVSHFGSVEGKLPQISSHVTFRNTELVRQMLVVWSGSVCVAPLKE